MGVLGGLSGLIGFLPFLLLGTVIRQRFIEKGEGALKLAFLVPLISFVPMVLAMLLCWWLAADYMLVFAFTGIAVFLLVTVVYTAMQVKRSTGLRKGTKW